jgi:hypothetical protein
MGFGGGRLTDAWRRRRDVALVVMAAGAPLVLLLAARVGPPADGAATFPSAPAWGDGVVIADVVGQSGDLRRGDRVVSVDGVALDTWVRDAADAVRGEPCVRRDGSEIAVPVTLRAYPLGELIAAHAALHLPRCWQWARTCCFVDPTIRPPARCSGWPRWSRWGRPRSRTPLRSSTWRPGSIVSERPW